ncbi:UNVERIFIED_CONTAM: CSC1-like protein RXW8 [Sesamum latifolium]|uniref:CSC1-like protein RXW8 n=1 Tax=Sesamum latifolium TaxID=2727402 RepID=A0AAW2WDN8_9LAMI
MDISGLLTSAGINTGICVGAFSLYSVLRKQPSLVSVYFARKLVQEQSRNQDSFWFGRLIPSASWIVKAWETSEDELYAAGGVDAVVFLRMVVFSLRVFTVAAVICLFLVLLNYFGTDMEHTQISNEPLSVFTIGNVKEGSKWLWAHCLALYIITCCACILLYYEYKNITKIRLAHIAASVSHPSYFTVIVRGIPWVQGESYSDTVAKFFADFYASSYFSHQMVYQSGAVQKLMSDAEKMYKMLKSTHMEKPCVPRLMRCGFCGGTATSFKMLSNEAKTPKEESCCFDGADVKKIAGFSPRLIITNCILEEFALYSGMQNCFGFLQDSLCCIACFRDSSITKSPVMGYKCCSRTTDIYWSNLCVPHQIFWIRKIIVLVASMLFVIFFLIPVVFTQGLVHLDKLQRIFPFLKDIGRRKVLVQLITGYLPSVVFVIFLYLVPPVMMFFSTIEGAISRGARKRSTSIKFVCFLIWNVFFANILTEAAIDHYQFTFTKLGDTKNIPNLLAKAVPATATYFMTYVLTSGWASLSCEIIQPFPLLCNLFYKYILRNMDDSSYGAYTFPYHTEVPRVLLFGVLGFTCSTIAPLILPFLLVYFFLAYLVYRNQILNVYVTEYDTGGLYWPIVHNTTIFSLVLTQIIALGVFGIKESPIASSFTIPLIISTLLFNEYCGQRFLPTFQKTPTKIIIEMDRKDEIAWMKCIRNCNPLIVSSDPGISICITPQNVVISLSLYWAALRWGMLPAWKIWRTVQERDDPYGNLNLGFEAPVVILSTTFVYTHSSSLIVRLD